MKKFLFLIVMLYVTIFGTPAMAIEGDGSEESPFLITTQEELELVSDFPDCHFELMNDIELQGEWVPLCSTTSGGFSGTFDGSYYTISNLNTNKDYAGLFSKNSINGVIKNTRVFVADDDAIHGGCVGGVAGQNRGAILQCEVKGTIKGSNYCGGIAGTNAGEISRCRVIGTIDETPFDSSAVGGIVGCNHTNGTISNSYFIGELIGDGYHTSDKRGYANLGGIAGYSYECAIKNCYAVPIFSLTSYGHEYGISENIAASDYCFYDTTVSGLTNTGYGTPKTTLAMKMKKTYSDAGWDFDNVWGISSDINDGYPYLLWEYEDNNSANTEIIGVTSTNNSLKFISEVAIDGELEIANFGTTFIPLWLFESGSTDTAIVSYDNSKYDIQNRQTFGATLTSIPESCKDMEIIGKSFIEDTDGNYIWSASKYSSVNDTTLKSLE